MMESEFSITGDCSICFRPIKPHPNDTRQEQWKKSGYKGWIHGNNPQPINEGRCCDTCDCLIVLPARMGMTGAKAIAFGQQMLELRINPPNLSELRKITESTGDYIAPFEEE